MFVEVHFNLASAMLIVPNFEDLQIWTHRYLYPARKCHSASGSRVIKLRADQEFE